MPEDYVSPVIMERVMVKCAIPGERGTEEVDTIEIRDAKTNALLGFSRIGYDDGVQALADILSSKGLSREANRLRSMVQKLRQRA